MEFQIIGKIFITIATLIYGIAPIFYDLNKTHATNPLWTGHARFHIVWQVMISFLISMFALYFLWCREYNIENIVIAVLLGVSLLGTFCINVLCMKFYDGKLSDENGVAKVSGFNPNLIGFLIGFLLLIFGFYLIILFTK